MREIVFHEVGMENFGPYIEPMVLPFKNDKLTLITGPNGIGKTMSLEALPFTLFGETCKKAKGDDVVNTRVGRNCHTWVKFSADSDNYRVDRYHKYTRLNNTVTIRKNDEDPYKKGHREVLPEIEKLICSKKSFTNTLMFGQKVKDFFTDLIDSDKKEIFRKILDLDIYTTWYKEADIDLKVIKEKIQNILEEIGIDTGILNDTINQIDIIFKQMNQFEETKKEKIINIKKSIENNNRILETWKKEKDILDNTPHDVEELKININSIKDKIQHHINEKENNILNLTNSRDLKIGEINNKSNDSIKSCIQKFRDLYNKASDEFTNNNNKLLDEENLIKDKMNIHSNKLTEIETEKRIGQKDINKINDSLEIDGICPTCLRNIDDECRKHLEDESLILLHNYNNYETIKKEIHKIQETNQVSLNDIREKKVHTNKIFEEYKNKISKEEQDYKLKIQEKIKDTNIKINNFAKNELDKIENDYISNSNSLQSELNKLNELMDTVLQTSNHIKEIETTISNLLQNISGMEIQLNIIEEDKFNKEQLNSYQLRKQTLEKSIQEKNKEISNKRNDEKISEFWKKAWSPSGILSMLIDESIPFMNKKVSEYLDKLTNGRYIVSFDTLAETKAGEFRDKISVNVLDTHTRANSRIQLSGGQTRIVDIATILTLGDLQSNIQDIKINILLFDEIFDSLDEENIGFVSNILSQLKVGKSIYLISHTQVEQLEADEILEFK